MSQEKIEVQPSQLVSTDERQVPPVQPVPPLERKNSDPLNRFFSLQNHLKGDPDLAISPTSPRTNSPRERSNSWLRHGQSSPRVQSSEASAEPAKQENGPK